MLIHKVVIQQRQTELPYQKWINLQLQYSAVLEYLGTPIENSHCGDLAPMYATLRSLHVLPHSSLLYMSAIPHVRNRGYLQNDIFLQQPSPTPSSHLPRLRPWDPCQIPVHVIVLFQIGVRVLYLYCIICAIVNSFLISFSLSSSRSHSRSFRTITFNR